MKVIIDEQKLLELYKSGETSKNIAKTLNVSRPTIIRRIRKHNAQRGPKYSLYENSFSTFNEESCYWAGFMAADAWVGSNHKKKKIYINLAMKDIDHLKKLCLFLKREIGAVRQTVRKRKDKTYQQCVLEIGNKQIVSDLVENFNVVQAKSFILQPPINIPSNLISPYIRGYMDGDGCISFNKKSITFNIVSGSKQLLVWINEKINEQLGFKIGMYERSSIWAIQTSGKKAQQILAWLYKNSNSEIRLDRKYNRYINAEDFHGVS